MAERTEHCSPVCVCSLQYLSPFKYTLSCFTLTIFLDATITSGNGPSVKGQDVSLFAF